MGQLGEMFPGAKIRREGSDEAGTGQGFEPGPLDLDSGVVRVRPRPAQPAEPAESTDSGEPDDEA